MIRNVRDLQPAEKRVLEQALGQTLTNEQQLRIEVIPVQKRETAPASADQHLPDWCDVFLGLTEDEVAELETSILDRSHWSR